MYDDLYVLRDRARAAAARGDVDGAVAALAAAAAQTHVAEPDYVSILRPLADGFEKRGDPRAALTVVAYLASVDPSAWTRAAALVPLVPPVDRAPVLAAQGRMAEAAHEMEGAGRGAAAAVYREKARDWTAARALWARLASRVARNTERGDDAYVTALVRFNLARCARQCGDARQAREATVASVRLLEEAADHFETVGLRERAFDCFQVLVQIGRESGAFEDVLEGFVNSIRILREDHLKYDFALDLFDQAVAAATDRGETRAAATLARQAAEYARSLGLTAAASEYALAQAQLWRSLARQQQTLGAPAEVIESALLAAVLAFGEVGQYARAGELYRELAGLELPAHRREHYARASKRYDGAGDEMVDAGPPARRSRRDVQSTEVWHADVLEWERQGSAAEACAEVLLDKRWDPLIRRKAMLARLAALRVEIEAGGSREASSEACVRLAEELGQLQLYVGLSPLETLYERGDRPIRLAVLQAMQTLCYKRSFVTVRAGLSDADPRVVEQAARAVEALYFPHAVDPLSRILREAPQAGVRASALRALARIDTVEAAEIVVGVLEHGSPVDRSSALAAIRETRGSKVVEVARAALPAATGALRSALREVLASRGLDA